MTGCRAPASIRNASTFTPSAMTPGESLAASIRNAYRVDVPETRLAAVLQATGEFLRDDYISAISDQEASSFYTDTAFSSGSLVLPQPALIQRNAGAAVVALPDGLGLYLYDLSIPAQPVELTRWTVGLDTVEVVWSGNGVGVGLRTQGNDGISRAHFVFARQALTGWQVSWQSDEQPDWWFNAYNATLDIEEDLSAVRVTGRAYATTQIIYELSVTDLREFTVTWQRQGDSYVLSPPVAAYPSWRDWLYAVSVPSPLAATIEFIERLQDEDTAGASRLVVSPDVLDSAVSYGLHLPGRRYQVVSQGDGQITIRELEGIYVLSMISPVNPGDPWKILAISLVGTTGPDS
nr:hypothetical protein [Anaerolineae bacterium]